MKIKRFLATLTAVLATGSVCALTACGSGDDAVSEKLTKEEWIAAFSEESFANMKFDGVEEETVYYEDYRGDTYTVKKKDFTLIKADGIYYMMEKHTSYDSRTQQTTYEYTWGCYYTIIEGEELVYSYDEDTNSWKRVAQTNAHYYYETFEDYDMSFFADLYDECLYDAKKGGYIWNSTDEDEGEIYSASAILKFKDKKFSEMVGESETTENDKVIDTGTYTYKFTYGGQSLTLPQIKEPEGAEKVTESEWIAAFSEELFTNMKVEIQHRSKESEYNELEVCEETAIIANGIYYHIYQGFQYEGDEEVNGDPYSGEAYYTEENGTMMSYIYYSDEGWSKGPAGQNGFEDNFGWIEEILGYGDLYGEFTFDSEKGGYILTITEEYGESVISVSLLFKFKDKKLYEVIGESTLTKNGEVIYADANSYKFTFGGQSLTLPNID